MKRLKNIILALIVIGVFGLVAVFTYYMEVAEMIGISQAQVSRLEKNALRTMRTYLTA